MGHFFKEGANREVKYGIKVLNIDKLDGGRKKVTLTVKELNKVLVNGAN